jgi:hypothetical protein
MSNETVRNQRGVKLTYGEAFSIAGSGVDIIGTSFAGKMLEGRFCEASIF